MRVVIVVCVVHEGKLQAEILRNLYVVIGTQIPALSDFILCTSNTNVMKVTVVGLLA
jgi:hypothetical protein